jgi:hypothetical protein
MAILECVDLNRPWGHILADRLPSDSEFHALHVVTRGLDALFAGRQPDAEFTRNFLRHPAVQAARLRYAPVGSKTQ